jgi:hypothetical protein
MFFVKLLIKYKFGVKSQSDFNKQGERCFICIFSNSLIITFHSTSYCVDNLVSKFISWYVATDLTGDNFVDKTDFAIADKNAANFVSAITP